MTPEELKRRRNIQLINNINLQNRRLRLQTVGVDGGGSGGSAPGIWTAFKETPLITARTNSDPNWKLTHFASQCFPMGHTDLLDPYLRIIVGAESDAVTGGVGESRDRSFIMRKLKTDGLLINEGWEIVRDGSNIPLPFLQRDSADTTSNESGQKYLGDVVDRGVGNDPRYIWYYSANRWSPSSSQYGVFWVGNNDLESPPGLVGTQIIPVSGASNNYFPRVIPPDHPGNPNPGKYTMLVSNVGSATGSRLFGVDVRTMDDYDGTGMAVIATDVLSNSTQDTRCILSSLWYEDNSWHCLMMTDLVQQFIAGSSGQLTTPYLGRTLKVWSSNDLINWTEGETIYTSSLDTCIAIDSWMGIMDHNGTKFTWIITFPWKSQTGGADGEPWANGILLAKMTNTPSGVIINTPSGREVYPEWISNGGIFRPDRPWLGPISPFDVLTQTPGTVVGSPTRAEYGAIKTGSGEVPRSVSSFTDDGGNTNLNLSGSLGTFTTGAQIRITGTALLDGVYTVLNAIANNDITINLVYNASNSFAGGLVSLETNNYCYRSGNIISDTKYFAFKIHFKRQILINAQYGLVSFTDDGGQGFYIRYENPRLEFSVSGAGGLKKVYRTGNLSLLASELDNASYFYAWFIFANGTLTIGGDYTQESAPVLDRNDIFTDILIPTTPILRIGYVPFDVNHFSAAGVKSCLWLNGQANATFEHLRDNDFI